MATTLTWTGKEPPLAGDIQDHLVGKGVAIGDGAVSVRNPHADEPPTEATVWEVVVDGNATQADLDAWEAPADPLAAVADALAELRAKDPDDLTAVERLALFYAAWLRPDL